MVQENKNGLGQASWVVKINVKKKTYQLFTAKYLSEEAA